MERLTTAQTPLNIIQISITTKMTATKDIIETTLESTKVALESTKTFAELVKVAGLEESLKGAGSFTVFVPSDTAFAAIQKDLDNLLLPESKERLVKILSYHVLSGTFMVGDLKDKQELVSVEGHTLKVSFDRKLDRQRVCINDATVITVDVAACNGIIHIIDKVLMPIV